MDNDNQSPLIKHRKHIYVLLMSLLLFSNHEAFAQKAVHFESAGDYIDVPHSASLNPQQFTIEVWLRVCEAREPDIFPSQTILQKRGIEFAESYSIDIGDLGFDFSIGAECGGIGLKVANVIEATKWYHIAVTQQADSLKMYLNGEYVRYYFEPQQQPWVGHYSCRDSLVVRQHLDWMQNYGIDLMAVSWWGQDYHDNFTLRDYMLPEMVGSSVKFCIFYETPILGMDAEIFIDETKEVQLVSDFTYFADNFFDHPNYFTIQGRPVVFLYLSGLLSGNYEQAFDHVRSELQNKGYGLYLIGAEMDWGEPRVDHMQFLDGVTSYLMLKYFDYKYAFDTDYLLKITHTASTWTDVCRIEGKGFTPTVHPGFNSNWLGEPWSLIVPRPMTPGASATSFYEEFIKVMRPFVDPQLKMMMISTWNEWHEDTQIEPTIVTETTNQDVSGEGLYTHGYSYTDYGKTFLEVTRKLLARGLLTDVGSRDALAAPTTYHLEQNYPNPFNQSTTIQFQVPKTAHVTIKIYNLLGEEVAELLNEQKAQGVYKVIWDATDQASGVYFYRFKAEAPSIGSEQGFSETRKLLLLK